MRIAKKKAESYYQNNHYFDLYSGYYKICFLKHIANGIIEHEEYAQKILVGKNNILSKNHCIMALLVADLSEDTIYDIWQEINKKENDSPRGKPAGYQSRKLPLFLNK